MKFTFIIAIVCASLSFAFGQFWFPSYQYQSYYPNPPQQTNPNTYPNQNQQNSYPNRYDDNSINQETKPFSLSLSSCESYWTVQNDGNGVWGQLSIDSPNKEKAIIKVILTLAAALPTEYVGDIDLLKSKQSSSADVANGLPIQYRVRFPLQHPIPKLTEIYYNNELLCRGQKATGLTVTTITLDHSFFTGLSNNNYYGNGNIYTVRPTQPPFTQPPVTYAPVTQPPVTQPPVTYRPQTKPPVTYRPQTKKTTTREPQIFIRPTLGPSSIDEKLTLLSTECGEPSFDNRNVTSLVVNGKLALPGQFPWLAAYYHNDEDFNGYICGGSLVSYKIVITAAHCVNDKANPSMVRKPEDSFIHLGKYNLRNQKGFLISSVTNIIMHTDWNPRAVSYDGDIAAIVLARTFDFTRLIQPICLWESTDSYMDIINRKGIVAGYGKTQTSVAESNVPYWSDLPVVDERTCFESNSIFVTMTSRRTFCAGSRDGSGPCNGDSGGAFIVQSGNKYYLRGIVSSSLKIPETQMCDTTNYAVFTDAVAFKDFIYTQIDTYG